MQTGDRLVQLLGAVGLATADRLRGDPEAAALVHLSAWPRTSVNALADVVGRSQPATVRLVDRLVEQGLVRRGDGPDRRTVGLEPTPAGRRSADAVLAARGRGVAELVAGLSADERAALEPLLARVAAGLADDRPGAVRVCRLCDRDACATGPGCPLDHTVSAPDPEADAAAGRAAGGGRG